MGMITCPTSWVVMAILSRLVLLAATTLIPYYQFRAPYNISPINEVTYGMLQSGAPVFCQSSNGTGQYTCGLGGVNLFAYTFGMTLTLWVDSTSNPATVRVNNLPLVSIKDLATGQNDVTVTAGVPHQIFYDGTVFRLEF